MALKWRGNQPMAKNGAGESANEANGIEMAGIANVKINVAMASGVAIEIKLAKYQPAWPRGGKWRQRGS
jgi:hypothetical protein